LVAGKQRINDRLGQFDDKRRRARKKFHRRAEPPQALYSPSFVKGEN
jgi:hypothetical protein